MQLLCQKLHLRHSKLGEHRSEEECREIGKEEVKNKRGKEEGEVIKYGNNKRKLKIPRMQRNVIQNNTD